MELVIYKNTLLKFKQDNRNVKGYWLGHLYHEVEGVHFYPGTFTYYGTLDDLLDLIDKGEDDGFFSVDVPSDEIQSGLEENGIDVEEWEGRDSWNVRFMGENKPDFFEEFELGKLLKEFNGE